MESSLTRKISKPQYHHLQTYIYFAKRFGMANNIKIVVSDYNIKFDPFDDRNISCKLVSR